MTMKNKKLLAVVSVILVLVIGIVGTIAYLTDRDSEVNVFTMGEVEIDLQENFDQNATLKPGVEITKEVMIKNTGDDAAWVWYTYAVPMEAEGVVDVQCSTDGWSTPTLVGTEKIDDIWYGVYACLYQTQLPADETTNIGMQKVTLNSQVDYNVNDGKYYLVNAGVVTEIEYDVAKTKIPVNAYAIQTEGFDTVDAAYAAYGIQWGLGSYANTALVDTPEDLQDAAKDGKDIVMGDDIEVAASKGGYNMAGIAPASGTTFDGAGNTFSATGANTTWDCVVYTTGGTIKNMTIKGGFRGIFTAGCSSDIIIDNVVIDDVCYTLSSDGFNSNYSIIVTDSIINGWTSYTDGYKSVLFTDCKFGQGTGGYKYAYCRPYAETTFTNCEFEAGYEFDATRTTCTFVNCTVGGVTVTADNVVELLGESAANIVIK